MLVNQLLLQQRRAGEQLEDEYYGEVADYTNKKGVIESEILVPEYVPKRLQDRKNLWNEVEQIEKTPTSPTSL